ncbi:fungal-specific transcription factor domain-containing protein [Calycina marina]|uniref:Fungal-specific transcription factor domain-containing protein n=1 Tax=Calycina marina TaxID=1763456 RepID=A0A9P7ZA18_9HELO|nr:fungal-specific transcription factor domain-containing protein [Calycina marina]
MDAAELFRQAQSSVNRAREAKSLRREESHESDDHYPRIAHTLTACCRCRQRKTRCDPNIPRCLPCERAGALCEYFDTAKGKIISRTYVIKLQDKVRALETELAQFTEEEGLPQNTEDIVRPGGLVRLSENDETPRFLGPSSGIAMTRLVMEEAKKYTDTRSIRELVPEVRLRRIPITSPTEAPIRKKSYPMISAVPALTLPSRLVTDKLVEVFNQKAVPSTAQYLLPTLHEPTFAVDLQEVYNGNTDPYKNFVLRMVLAISMQKLDTQYAGLADSYYLAAMSFIEAVIRPKDIKTLQCLVLIAQYSMLTPTRTAIYYVIGLATRLCQQLGLTEEKTIVQGLRDGSISPLQVDMRRRLSWIVLSMEFGLAHSMGRPSAFATGQDHVDVGFFEAKDDGYITVDGILPGPVSDKKAVAIHFFKMRLLQTEIKRVLYQKKRKEPQREDHPWYAQMEQKLKDWVDSCPQEPSWSKPWFIGRYNTMIVFLFRPSPQVPNPAVRSAILCYDASAYNVKVQAKQMYSGLIDITWIFLMSSFMAVNTILWTISYPEVRSLHSKEEIEEHIDLALDVIDKCRERWPGTSAASQLYSKLSKACLKSYDVNEGSNPPSSLSANSPSSLTDTNSPSASEHSSTTTGSVAHSQKAVNSSSPPQFSYVFDQLPEPIPAFDYSASLQTGHSGFRSNSIFMNPSSAQSDRRFSYFPPDFTQPPLPDAWVPNAIGTSDTQFAVPAPTSQPMAEEYFMQPPTFSFGEHMFQNAGFDTEMRHGSLSQEQQIELMQTLEKDGLSEIDNFMTLSSQQYNQIKFEPSFQ